MTNLLPQRKILRLRHHDYAQAGMYFVTVCAHDRRSLFGSVVDDKMQLNELGYLIEGCWNALPFQTKCVCLDEFVLMPNHLHGVLVLDAEQKPGAINRAPTLGNIIRAFKARCARSCRGAVHGFGSSPLWQRNYYEHVIRSEDELMRIREYIRNNPVQWSLDRNNPESDGRDKSRPYGL